MPRGNRVRTDLHPGHLSHRVLQGDDTSAYPGNDISVPDYSSVSVSQSKLIQRGAILEKSYFETNPLRKSWILWCYLSPHKASPVEPVEIVENRLEVLPGKFLGQYQTLHIANPFAQVRLYDNGHADRICGNKTSKPV